MLGARWIAEGSRPETELPLSFQMYSAVDLGEYTGTLADGSTVPLSLDALPPVTRGIGYGDDVPQEFCAANKELVSVQKEVKHPALQMGEHKC